MPEDRRHAAIMFTDIVGYTALMGSDEDAAFDMLARNHTLHEALIEKHNGILIKEVGDGTLASFPLASNAVRCAIDIQKEAIEQSIPLKIGIHEGEMVFAGADVLGDGVNIASRLQEVSKVGCITISGNVYNNVKNKAGINTKFIGDKKLKNVDDAVKVYEVLCKEEEKKSTKDIEPKKRRIKLVYYIIGGLIVIMAAIFIWYNMSKDDIPLPASETITEEIDRSIAVLPFENISGDPEQEYFCDGMTEEIITTLSHVESLKVIARTSSFVFKGKNEDMREIGRKLDVTHLLEGSVRKAGNRLRITAQLIKVSDGSHLWSERYDRDLEDIFAIQDEISLAIVDNLKIKLLEKEKAAIVKRYTEDLEASNLYLKGNYYWQRLTADGFKKATEYFEQSLQKDPHYALAYVGLARVYRISSFWGNMPPNEAYPKVKEYLKKAIDIDNTLAEAHTTLGNINLFYEWDFKAAEKELKLALQLNPNSSLSHLYYSFLLTFTERHEEAIAEAKQAQKLDPLYSYSNTMLGGAYFYAGQFDRAIEVQRMTIDMNPSYFLAHFHLGHAYMGKSMIQEAIEEFEKAVDFSGGAPVVVSWLACAYYEIGKKKQAEELIDSLKQRSEKEYVPASCFILYYVLRGDLDQAYKWSEQAIDEHDSFINWGISLPIDRYLILDDPRINELLKKVGLKRKGI